MIQIKTSKFWLTAIAFSLVAIHLTTVWKGGYIDLLGIDFLIWMVVYHLIWKKHQNLHLKAGVLARIAGTVIIATVLVGSLCSIHRFPYISPFLSACGLALVASGFKGLKQYRQELFILVFPVIAKVSLLFLFNLPELTAKLATFILWYSGFAVSRDGVEIALQTGTVKVNQGCSGLETILQLLVLSVLFLVMFPLSDRKKFLVPAIAGCIGFVVNSLRVALMAVLVACSDKKAFEYWHNGDGSLIFSTIAVFIFGLFCLWLLRLHEKKQKGKIKVQKAVLKSCPLPKK